MEFRLKIGNFIKTASHSSPHSNSGSDKKIKDSKDSPGSGTETQSSYRLGEEFCSKLQIDLGYITRDALNLDPEKQNQDAVNTTTMEMKDAVSDSGSAQRNDNEQQSNVIVDPNDQGTHTCCHCAVF